LLPVTQHGGCTNFWLSIGNTFSFGGKPGEKGIDLSRTEFLRVSQLMKANEIAEPVPVGLFSTDAVVMQAHHCLDLFTQA